MGTWLGMTARESCNETPELGGHASLMQAGPSPAWNGMRCRGPGLHVPTLTHRASSPGPGPEDKGVSRRYPLLGKQDWDKASPNMTLFITGVHGPLWVAYFFRESSAP